MTAADRDEGARVSPGLCGRCLHSHRIASKRGSVFWLCERSRTDPRFPRYPRLPVVMCVGYEAVGGERVSRG